MAVRLTLPTYYEFLTAREMLAVHEQYKVLQKGKCWFCGFSLDELQPKEIEEAYPIAPHEWSAFPGGRGFLMTREHLHHSHVTGLTIGVTHAYCNALMWIHAGE